jgi:fumarylacetoacetase
MAAAPAPQPRSSWVPGADGSDFCIRNIPFGVFASPSTGAPAIATAIGPQLLDLRALAAAGLLPPASAPALQEPTLNAFMALGRPAWSAVRARLQALLAAEGEAGADGALRGNAALCAAALLPRAGARMLLPATVGDYTDFYSSKDHAYNVGVMIRGPANALQPNWTWLPVGYHGRASSVVVSGTDIVRPCGQTQADAADAAKGAAFGPSKRMDFELEVATWVGPGSELGRPIPIARAEEHIFGLCLMNDWSARDIQVWEYVPLGPFGAKNFGTTVSPWIVTLEALAPFRCATSTPQDPPPLPYLADPVAGSYDIALEVALQGEGMAEPAVITRSNFKHMYWNLRQQLVHHTVTGCNMRPGDLLGSGTISGPVRCVAGGGARTHAGTHARSNSPPHCTTPHVPPLTHSLLRPPRAAAACWSCPGRARRPSSCPTAKRAFSSRTGTRSSCAACARMPPLACALALASALASCCPPTPRSKEQVIRGTIFYCPLPLLSLSLSLSDPRCPPPPSPLPPHTPHARSVGHGREDGVEKLLIAHHHVLGVGRDPAARARGLAQRARQRCALRPRQAQARRHQGIQKGANAQGARAARVVEGEGAVELQAPRAKGAPQALQQRCALCARAEGSVHVHRGLRGGGAGVLPGGRGRRGRALLRLRLRLLRRGRQGGIEGRRWQRAGRASRGGARAARG